MLGRDIRKEYFVVGDAVLPIGEDSSEPRLLEPLQTFDVTTIQCPRLVSIQMVGKCRGSEDRGFCSYRKAVIAEDPVRKRSVRTMNRFDPVVKVPFATG